jgi:hemolysin activation/secretion protein
MSVLAGNDLGARSAARRGASIWVAAGLLAGTPGAALSAAATPPSQPPPPSAISGGLIQKGTDLERDLHTAPAAPITGPPPTGGPATAVRGAGPSFLVARIEFSPSRFLKPAELQRLALPLEGKQVTLAALQKVADAVNTLYARRGVLTGRAFVSPQRVVGGVVHIDLVESRLGRLTVVPGAYTHADFAGRRITLRAGEVVDMGRLRDAIGVFNRTSDTQAQASLSPGKDPGQTDVRLTVRDPSRVTIQLFSDNNGYSSTGREEGGAILRFNHLLRDGDHVSVYVAGSAGSITGNALYSLPVGVAGGRLGLSYSHSHIATVSGPTQVLGVRGDSDSVTVNLAQPFVSGADWNLSAVGAVTAVRSTDTVSSQATGRSLTVKSTVGASAARTFGAWAALSGDLTGSWAGVGYYVGSGPGQFWQTNADFTFSTATWHGLSVRFAGQAQYVDRKTLPGSQLFQVGGASSVRGFEAGTASGYAGYAAQSELHAEAPGKLRAILDPYVFADTGEVDSDARHHTRISGAGVGLVITPGRHVTLQASYAFALDRLSPSQYRDRLDVRAVVAF